MKERMPERMNAGAGDDLHERARRLIDTERVEGLAPSDQRWLEEHLAGCEACTGRAAATDATLRTLKTARVPVPHGLAASTQSIVRRRANELRAQRGRNVALAAGCTFSWLLGVASAPLVWRACAWVGATFELPRLLWIAGFVAWWLVPAAAMGLVILWQRRHAEAESRAFGPEWERR
jgi:hypothetical protein